ncbi:MAG: VCBS repeat-containing protein [Moorella sp. (in: firmicutes)]
MKKKWLVVVSTVITLSLVLLGCAQRWTNDRQLDNKDSTQVRNDNQKSSDRDNEEISQEIELSYTPEPVTALETGKPEKGWEEQKAVPLDDVSGQGKALVRLYMRPGPDRERRGEVHAFLEAGGETYDLGIVGSYGLHGVSVQTADKNGDGARELVITGGMGAAYGEMKIIGYDAGKKRWVKLLVMGTPYGGTGGVDLDGDGREELVAVSGGSLPGYVWIYRWNGDHFEKADVAGATANLYANIDRLDGTVWIEAGKPNEPHYYQYRNGRLLQIPRPSVAGVVGK